MSKLHLLFVVALTAASAAAQDCDLKEYKPLDGLKAEIRNGVLEFSWQGGVGRSCVRASRSVTASASQRFRPSWLQRTGGLFRRLPRFADRGFLLVPARHFPSIGEYSSLLARNGLEVETAAVFTRPTAIEGGSGLRD